MTFGDCGPRVQRMHGANTSLRRTCVLFQARNNPAGLARITFFDFYRQRTELCELLYARSVQDTSSNVAWFFAVPLASRSSLRARGIDSRARGTSVRRAALLHASPVESADQPPRAITLVWCATAFGDEPTRPLRTLVDESGFGEGPVRRPRGDDAKGAVHPRRALSSCLVIVDARTVDSKKRSVPRRPACR